MKPILPGIHHVTAITADPQANLEFYSGTLGLRLVKVTVNFDDPGSYHLYYGDRAGTPGTIMTFFSGGIRGRRGSGEVSATTFAVPAGSLEFWRERLRAAEGLRFGQPVLRFRDPDGMPLEIVEAGPAKGTNILGFHGATLTLSRSERTAELLTGDMGFRLVASEGNRTRYSADGDFAGYVDLVQDETLQPSRMGAGVVHHLAFRTPDDANQEGWLAELRARGYRVSPVMDRNYFHSIYFREPGGVLFEIATDPPGFTADQPLEELGTRLVLPSWLEPHRATLEKALPPLQLPGVLAG
jgi:glyoxalase family protein